MGIASCAIAAAVLLAVSPIAQGYFDFQLWGVIALGLLATVIALMRVAGPAMGWSSAAASAGLALLLLLSGASWLWAESKESVWTDTNRLAFYCAVFAIVLLAVRRARTARTIMIVLGAPALITAVWLCGALLLGSASDVLAGRRVDVPIGYINANAGLLLMGLWPWVALAETARKPMVRAASLGAATLIACCAVLTQSRALLPGILAATLLVLLCSRGVVTRALNLLLVSTAVAASLPWTLGVYSAGGQAARQLPPDPSVARAAAVTILAASLGCTLLRLASSRCGDRLEASRIRRVRRNAAIALLAVGAPLAVAGIVVAAPSISRQYHSFTAMRFNDAVPVRILDAGGYRYDLWRVAVREFERHPFMGVGAGNYDVEYYRLRRNPEYVLQPHSLELQTAAELGIGGIVALLLFCGGVLFGCFSRRATLAPDNRFVNVAAGGMFAAWLAVTSVDWLYDLPGITGMAVMAAALLVVRVERPARRPRPAAARIWRVMVVAVVAVLAASIGRQYLATQYARIGTHDLTQSPRAAVSHLRRASSLDPNSLTTLYGLAAAYARQNDYHDARAALLSAAAREPHNFVPPALLGDLARRRGDLRLAASEYAVARRLDPRDVHASVALRAHRGSR